MTGEGGFQAPKSFAARSMWAQLIELQPQTGGSKTGTSREEFIGGIASGINHFSLK